MATVVVRSGFEWGYLVLRDAGGTKGPSTGGEYDGSWVSGLVESKVGRGLDNRVRVLLEDVAGRL